jgi:hypothetical protein
MRVSLMMTCLLAATLAAQQEPAPAAKATPAARLQALFAEQKQLLEDFQKQQAEAAEARKKAPPGTAPKAARMGADVAPLIAKAREAAKEYAGTGDAIGFLVWIAQYGAQDKAAFGEAMHTLAEHHVDDARVAGAGPVFARLESAVGKGAGALLEKFAGSKDAEVRGYAALARHRATIEKANPAEEPYQSAKRELLLAAEATTDARLKGEIQSVIDLREKFSIGSVAPDIEGSDLAGVAFKLSDYKGKVIFLDFWGDW